MVHQLITTYKRLLDGTRYDHHRYLLETFRLSNRLTGLMGSRGTGKTTLLLQYIRDHIEDKDECIYVSADHIYFSRNLLLNFVQEMVEDHGVRYFFIDEIHKYPNWNQELKNIYDSFPDVTTVFSGSSSMDLVKGAYDLSRRGVLFRLHGMSFREYLSFKGIADIPTCSLDTLLEDRTALEKKVAGINRIKGHFKDYLGAGYYPFIMEGTEYYHQKLLHVIEKIVFEDISNFYKLKTENLPNFKKILAYVSTIPPGELNRNSVSKHIGLDNKTVSHYLSILQETGLIELIRENKSGSAMLKSTEKIFLDNPDLYCCVGQEVGQPPSTGTLREIFFLKMIRNAGFSPYYSKTGDYEVNGTIFEIGGKNKSRKQIKTAKAPSFIVKDDILYGSKRDIPLYLFGFLY